MATILVTGIPRIGKSDLIDASRDCSEQYYERPVQIISLGELVAEQAHRLWGTAEPRVPSLDYSYQQALRSQAIARAAFELQSVHAHRQQRLLEERIRSLEAERHQLFQDLKHVADNWQRDTPLEQPLRAILSSKTATEEERERILLNLNQATDVHIIIDTPMTMYLFRGSDDKNTIPDIIFTQEDISRLHRAKTLDYVVTVIDDAYHVAERFKHSPYPENPSTILDWIAIEVNATRSVMPFKTERKQGRRLQIVPRRHLVVPREHSEETLAKLLNDEQPPIVYLAGPITHLKINDADTPEIRQKKEEARNAMAAFRDKLQEYAVVVTPMEMADGRITDKDIANTVFRDIHWFVENADATIAYFPTALHSTGTMEELRATLRFGKHAILIRPVGAGERQGEAFGVRPTLHFGCAEDFFAALHQSRQQPYHQDPRYNILRQMLDPHQDVPRYAHLRPYAVAIDIQQDGKHLLGLQAQGKGYAGNWMMIAGKKERISGVLETDVEALRREAWQEIGIHLLGVKPGYRLFPVDYAKGGSKIQYVRVYQATSIEGKVREDNVVKHPEIERVDWFTPQQIASMDNVVPATKRYFQELLG